MIGRLKPGVPVGQAQAEIQALAPQIDARESASAISFEGHVKPLAEQVSGRIRLAVWVLAAAVGVVMLIVVREPLESAARADGLAAEGNRDPQRARRRTPAADRRRC